jgi:hypothetical protein
VISVIHQLPLHLLRNVDERVARDAIDRFLHRGVGLALGLLGCACEDEKNDCECEDGKMDLILWFQ